MWLTNEKRIRGELELVTNYWESETSNWIQMWLQHAMCIYIPLYVRLRIKSLGLISMDRAWPTLSLKIWEHSRFSSRAWQSCRVRYLFSDQLRLSMEHHARVSIIVPGWGSINLSNFTHHPPRFGYSYWEGRARSLTTVEWFLTLIHWLGPPFLYRGDPNPC